MTHPPSVAQLGKRILKAWDRGDASRAQPLVAAMIDIACSRKPEHGGEASVAAFQWLAAHDGGVIDKAVREELWRHPEILVEAARALRRVARESPDLKQRREAEAVLKRYGYDDASLQQDNGD